VAKQQPTLEYGLAYLHHRNTIINEKYDKAITYYYNWPKFIMHWLDKLQWSEQTFNSVHWKAFQHQGKKLTITRRTHLLKFVYEWLPIRETLLRIDSTATPNCPSCNCPMETHSHIFRCFNPQRQQITIECISQLRTINTKWKVPEQLTTSILEHLTSWVTNEPVPHMGQIATDPAHIKAVETQTSIGWGRFFKGFCATEIQNVVNTHCEVPINRFEQLRWTSEVIQCVWDFKAEHWKARNGDKHGHMPAETNSKKREHLLTIARDLIQTQYPLPPRHRKMFPAYSKRIKKRTQNLETWVNTTQQTVHYLLNVNNQAGDDPDNIIQPELPNQTGTHLLANGLPTPPGSEASQVPPNITA
jgi:hypothetical protein